MHVLYRQGYSITGTNKRQDQFKLIRWGEKITLAGVMHPLHKVLVQYMDNMLLLSVGV